jgi:serine/threonine-protein kinase RsbT
MGAAVTFGGGGHGDPPVSENWQRLRISSQNDVSLAIVAVRELAIRQTMSSGEAAALVTAVSELVTNVVKYAGTGLVSLRPTRQIQRPGIEVVVEDQGPGIANIAEAMKDYVSTGGTLGLGLPGARRLVDEFDIVSRPGQGTRIRIVKWR